MAGMSRIELIELVGALQEERDSLRRQLAGAQGLGLVIPKIEGYPYEEDILTLLRRCKAAEEELGSFRDSHAYVKELYDRVFDDREALLKALRLCLEKGHHDTCSHALSKEYFCDCGYEEGCKAIGNRMSGKGLAAIAKALEAEGR